MPTRFLRYRPGQLSGRFAIWVILFSSAIALLITVAELAYSYLRDVRAIDARMAQIRDAYVDSVTENLWVADKERLDTQLTGIVRLPDFVLAEIRVDGTTELRKVQGPLGKDKGVRQVFVLQRMHQGRLQTIGELVVQASYEGAWQRMLQHALIYLAANALKTLMVSLFIVVIFYRLIGRHIEKISLYAHEHDHPGEAPILKLNREEPRQPDELSELVAAINHLRRQLLIHARRETLRAQTLEQLVAERTAQIEAKQQALLRAKDDAEWASRAKSHFLSTMSHEFRTPLNAVLGFAQLLEMSEHCQQDKESLRQITDAGRQLLSMVENVLALTANERPQLAGDMVSVRVRELFEDEEDHWKAVLATGNMTLQVELDKDAGAASVRVDRQRFLHALSNYVDNAARYGQQSGVVRVGAEHRDGGRIRFFVTNEGVGIPPERLGELFLPFSRLGREGGSILGAGLGLSVTQEMVASMAGEVGVTSEEGRSTTFWIDLPEAVG